MICKWWERGCENARLWTNAFEILLPTDKREGKWSLFAQEAKFRTYANIMQNYVYFDNRFKDKCQWIRTILIFVFFVYLACGLGLNQNPIGFCLISPNDNQYKPNMQKTRHSRKLVFPYLAGGLFALSRFAENKMDRA